MLNQAHIDIVKATVPVLEEHGTAITGVFYQNMFADHPELLDVFNKTNQSQGRQQTALAMTVLAAAKHINELGVLLPEVVQIGHKHRALDIKPEHYPIVGKHLLKAIKEVLGDAATPEIIDAWAAAYGEIADVFISVEADLYQKADWDGFQPFRISNKQLVAEDIAEFTVQPGKDCPVQLEQLTLHAGQYITVKTHPADSDNLALRHYSLCSIDTEQGLRFAVKRDNRDTHRGLVSNYLHDQIGIGDEILLSAPAGDFVLEEKLIRQSEVPLVLVSAGVGVTPVVAMLEKQVTEYPQRPIIWAYACKNEANHAFKSRVAQLLAQASDADSKIFYADDNQRLNQAWLETLPNPVDIYVCGSVGFMEKIIGGLLHLTHKNDTIHYEPFGPKMSIQPQAAE